MPFFTVRFVGSGCTRSVTMRRGTFRHGVRPPCLPPVWPAHRAVCAQYALQHVCRTASCDPATCCEKRVHFNTCMLHGALHLARCGDSVTTPHSPETRARKSPPMLSSTRRFLDLPTASHVRCTILYKKPRLRRYAGAIASSMGSG